MKNFALIAVMAAAVALTACNKHHEKVYAVDRVEAAQAAALEKAPKAEEMIFDDHGQPTFVELSGGAAAQTTTDAAAPATDAAATDATATAAAPADAAATPAADAAAPATDAAK